MRRCALIIGITGQDGAYLTELLLQKGYEVHGIVRRASTPNTGRIQHLEEQIKLHYGDLTDSLNLTRLVREIQPTEVYNLGAQSHVAVSFEAPEYTADVDALGTLRVLEAIRSADLTKSCRFYQASTSELFGKVQEMPQKETTPFYPRSPYAVAKLYAYWITVNYREAYGMYACNGILFNHESKHRGETFVTRKITKALTRIVHGLQDKVSLGNLDAKRDWGHARDYVEMQWLMLQQDSPEDYVIATGKQHSVRDFVNAAAKEVGITLHWEGSGVEEVGTVASVNVDKSKGLVPKVKLGAPVVVVDPQFFRPAEVETLLGDASKAREKLGWTPQTSLEEMVREMVVADTALASAEAVQRRDADIDAAKAMARRDKVPAGTTMV